MAVLLEEAAHAAALIDERKVETATPSLLELQCAMRASLVVHDDHGISAHVVDAGMSPASGSTCTVAPLRACSRRRCACRILPWHRLVGAEFFEGAARIFIEAHPPKSACLDDYGEKFADFLSDFEPAASLATCQK